jgi:dolichyl-phosphate beta-glucosyltransferase
MKDVFLSIVIPAYNEEKKIGRTLSLIVDYLNKKIFDWEIIVIDDGSRDRTKDIIKRFMGDKRISLIGNEKNRGKGYSVKKGILRAQGGFILFSDADLSTPIDEMDKLFLCLRNGYDIAIGSRGLEESKIIIPQFWIRQTMGKIFNLIIRFFILPGIKDTQCGFKLFKGSIAKKVFSLLKIDGFAFDVEVLYIAEKLNLKIKEVPIKWYDSPESKVNPTIDSFKMLIDVCKIKMRSIRKKYRCTKINDNASRKESGVGKSS